MSPAMEGIFDWFKRPEPPRPQGPPPPRMATDLPVNVDLYAIFGQTSQATDDQLRQAYRDLAMKFHPDRNPDDPVAERKFREISQAYDILRDTDQRLRYDRARAAAGAVPTPPRPPPPPPPARYPAVIPSTLPGEPRAPGGITPARPAAPSAAPPQPTLFSVLFGGPETHAPMKTTFATFAPPPPRPGAPPAAAPPPPPPPAFWGAPPLYAAPPPVPLPRYAPPSALPPPPAVPSGVVLPSIGEMADMVSRLWPLEAVWDVVRTERAAPRFRETGGVMTIDRIAGVSEPIEHEIAHFFGVSPELVNEYLQAGTAGREALWTNLYYPLFDLLTGAMDLLKPGDLPGRFGLDWDMNKTGIDFLYVEQPFRG